MTKTFGTLVLVTALFLTACGRDNQAGQQPGAYQPGPVVDQPSYGYDNTGGGGVAGYCGFFCRWRMRRQQRLGGCY